jgi:hypothetical protein
LLTTRAANSVAKILGLGSALRAKLEQTDPRGGWLLSWYDTKQFGEIEAKSNAEIRARINSYGGQKEPPLGNGNHEDDPLVDENGGIHVVPGK